MADQEYAEPELNLRDYLMVIAKRRKFVLETFLLFFICSLLMIVPGEKTYNISMVVLPPANEKSFIDTPENIQAILKSGALDSKVAKSLGLDYKKTNFSLNIANTTNTKAIRISLEDKNKDFGIKILNSFFNELSKLYLPEIELAKNNITQQAQIISNSIPLIEDNIMVIEKRIKIMEQREGRLTDEVKGVKANADKLLEARINLVDNGKKENDISMLLYTSFIQANINYYNELNNQLLSIKSSILERLNDINTMQNNIKNAKIEIEKLESSKDGISNIKLIQDPEISGKSTKISKKQNLIMMTAFSFMFSIFLAFSAEYWEKLKKTNG